MPIKAVTNVRWKLFELLKTNEEKNETKENKNNIEFKKKKPSIKYKWIYKQTKGKGKEQHNVSDKKKKVGEKNVKNSNEMSRFYCLIKKNCFFF